MGNIYEYWLCDTQAEGSHPLPGLSAPLNPRNAQPVPPNRTRYPNYSETSANDNSNHAQQLLESWQVAIGTCGPTQLDNFPSLNLFGNFGPFWILYGPCSAFGLGAISKANLFLSAEGTIIDRE